MWRASGIHLRPSTFYYLHEWHLFHIQIVIVHPICWRHNCILLNSNLDSLYDTVNCELKEVCNWFKCNKLSLNTAKTNLMFIGTSYQTNQIDDKKSIYLDGCKLTRGTEAKFLGITLDSNLTWIPHINAISKKCSKNLGVLNKVKHFPPETAMYQLYCTLILP